MGELQTRHIPSDLAAKVHDVMGNGQGHQLYVGIVFEGLQQPPNILGTRQKDRVID